MLMLKRIAAWLAVTLFTAATVGALLQPLYPDPFEPKEGWDQILYPTETNAFTRLSSISADLNDLHVEPGEDGSTNQIYTHVMNKDINGLTSSLVGLMD